MYRIALCDDEPAELEKTERLLRNYEKKHSGLEFAIRSFDKADELLRVMGEERERPDLIFMDIYMPDAEHNVCPAGIETARKLRGRAYEGRLIFLTSSKEHALEAFEVDAQQYLVKPIEDDGMSSLMDKLLKEMEEERKRYILLRIEGRFERVPLNDIVYCEAQGKTQSLCLSDGTKCTLRTTLTELYEQLSVYQEFVRVGVAFIVNLGYIGSLNAKEIHMDNGTKIYLPRGTYKGLREQYLNYYCGERE